MPNLPPDNAVRAGALSNWDSLVSSLGGDPEAIAQLAGLKLSVLQHPDTYIPYEVFERALATAAIQLSCSDFGLRLGATHDISVLGPVGLLMSQSATLFDAMQLASSYIGIHVRDELWQLEADNEYCRIVRYQHQHYLEDDRQTRELSIATVTSLLRSLGGVSCMPEAIYFSHSPTTDKIQYKKLLGLLPIFESERDQLTLSSKVLKLKPQKLKQPTIDTIESNLQRQLATLDNDIEQQTRWLLSCTHSDSQLTIHSIANMLHMSPRTLQRRLQEKGTDFRQLLLHTRMHSAARYLRNNRVSVSQVAALAGYEDISAFSRAFSRHTGVSPRAYRQTLSASAT
jgi:AraC-like DNA-binding protein